MSTLKIAMVHPEGTLHAEVCTHLEYGDLDPTWYVDAAHIEHPPGQKLRDLTDDEITALDDQKDATFNQAVGEAYKEWERDYDPTP